MFIDLQRLLGVIYSYGFLIGKNSPKVGSFTVAYSGSQNLNGLSLMVSSWLRLTNL